MAAGARVGQTIERTSMQATTFIALLRGVNVGGRNLVPMAELRELCEGLGWADVRTYIASGNLVFEAEGDEGRVARELQSAVERRFGIETPAIVRSAAAWKAYVDGNPFSNASEREPGLVMLALANRAPDDGAAETLRARARDGERIEPVGDALWIHYPSGSGRSKLSPGTLDKAVGSPVTTRNWRTVVKLWEMAGGT
jgi:uncharacterized protein (DUF1697 family)